MKNHRIILPAALALIAGVHPADAQAARQQRHDPVIEVREVLDRVFNFID